MADKREYSVDDILSEISAHRSTSESAADFDLDEILGLKVKSKAQEPPAFEEVAAQAKPPMRQEQPDKLVFKSADSHADVKKRGEAPAQQRRAADEAAETKHKAQAPARQKPADAQPAKPTRMVFSPEELADTRTIFSDDAPIRPKEQKKDRDEDDGRLSFERHNITPLGQKKNEEPIKRAKSNDALLDSLNQSLKEHQAEQKQLDESEPKRPVRVFEVSSELKQKVIKDTEQMTMERPVLEEDKIRELKAKRRQKIRDFVLEPAEEGVRRPVEAKAKETAEEIDDYNSYDDTPSILHDLNQIQGSLLLRLFMLVCMGVIALYISVANEFSLPIIEFFDQSIHPEGFMYVNIILGVLAAFVSYTVVSGGLLNLFAREADSDTVAAVAILMSVVSALALLFEPAMIKLDRAQLYIVVAIFGLIFNTLGKLQIVGRTRRNFRFVSGDAPKYAASVLEDEAQAEGFTRGTISDFPVLGSMRKTEFLSGFLKHSYSADYADHLSRRVVPLVLALALILSVAVYFVLDRSIFLALNVFTAAVCVASPFATMLIVNIPLSRVSRNLIKQSSVVLGYSTVEEFADVNSLLVDAEQLFPEGSIDLIGFKIFGNTKIDDAFLDAASLSIHAGSVLSHMFYDVIGGKKTMLKQVESYIYEDSMGMSGWIGNKRVLLGNRELMRNHSIDLPPVSKEQKYVKGDKNVMYLSVSGDLAAMFIVGMKPNFEVKRYLHELERQGVYLMLRTVDSIVTINKLAEMFEISPNILKILPFRLHESFDKHTGYLPRHSGSLSCNGRFVSFAAALLACKRTRKNVMVGAAVQTASIILGLIMVSVLSFMSSPDQLSAINQFSAAVMLLYNAAWAFLVVALQRAAKL